MVEPASWPEYGGILWRTFRWVIRRLGISDDPFLEIDVADPRRYPQVYQAEGVDWPHLVVTNIGLPKAWKGKTRPAIGVRVRVHYLGSDYKMLWQGHDGPVETVNIYREDPEFIVFVFRGFNDPDAYLTDVYFLKHTARNVLLNVGLHQFTVDIYYPPHEQVTAQVDVNVPPVGHGSVTARKVGNSIRR